jgi:F-type H+-transporting ATPase subunit alpha
MGEYFTETRGQDALIVYDDLIKTSRSLSAEISLLTCEGRQDEKRIPGDVFYLHSRLLERGARVNADYVEKVHEREG